VTYLCPEDDGNLDVVMDLEQIQEEMTPAKILQSQDFSIWRYLPLFPVSDPGHLGTPLRSVGWTPLYQADRVGGALGLEHLWIKDDGRNPTASFKDRASAVVVARAQEIGAEVVITASTGNAGAALAGMAAAAQVPSIILAPQNAPAAKVAQLLVFGAKVFLVDGNYDDAFDLSVEAAQAFDWYCRNTGYNPFTAEGKKSASFEICEGLTRAIRGSDRSSSTWEAPDAIFVSVGDGNIISGLHKGLKDLLALGWIERMPRLIGVQSEGSAAIYRAFKSGSETISPVQADTIADSISVNMPRDGVRALRAATETGGAYLSVSDGSILEAMRELASSEGVFAEPAGATPWAGLRQALREGMVAKEDCILVLITGSGLKDVDAARDAVGEPVIIEPELDSLAAVLKD
jgi:threonine synthase